MLKIVLFPLKVIFSIVKWPIKKYLIKRYKLGGREAWDVVGPHYNVAAPQIMVYKQMTESTCNFIRSTEQEGEDADNKILILSCGSGILEKEFNNAYGYLPEIVAVDFSEEMIRLHKKNNPTANIERHCIDAKEFMDGLPANSFRRVIINNGIIEPKEGILPYLKKVKRIIKDDGEYHISVVMEYGPRMLLQSQGNIPSGWSIPKLWETIKFYFENKKELAPVFTFAKWVFIVQFVGLTENEVFISQEEWKDNFNKAGLSPNKRMWPYGGGEVYMEDGKPLAIIMEGRVEKSESKDA